MMSLACAHAPSMSGWPSGVRGGIQFESSVGGFLGSIQPGGGAFFGGGGVCAPLRTAVADINAASNKVTSAPGNRPVIDPPLTLAASHETRCQTYSTRIPAAEDSIPCGGRGSCSY